MGDASTLLLGFIAGVTILLGLPLGRLRSPAPGMRVFIP
jgi:ZIP family zinc transporter